MNDFNITPEFAEWFGAWIGDGDHSTYKKSVTLCNQECDLLNLHIKILTEYFEFPKERILVELTTSNSDSVEIIKNRWATKLSLPADNIRTINRNKHAREECARVVANNAEMFRFLRNNTTAIKFKISNSREENKAAFIRGLYAAEGSIRTERHQKHLRLGMKPIEEIAFAQKLLEDLKIQSRIDFNPCNCAYELSVYGFENLLRFYEIGGFGRYKKKNDILQKQLEYGKLPWSFRFKCLVTILKNKTPVTSKEVAELFNTGYDNAKLMLATFAKFGMLNVDKTNKTYLYSLNETCLKCK